MKITAEDRAILGKLSLTSLRFLSKVAEDKDFPAYIKLMEELCNFEKDRTFGLNEDDKLLVEHAYARGRVAGYLQSATLMSAARSEIERREDERRKKRG